MKKNHSPLRKSSIAAIFFATGLSIMPAPTLATGIPTIDIAAIFEAIIQEFNQLDQLAELNSQTLQQLVDYQLQLQNLQQLPGEIRSQIQAGVLQQLKNNIADFGLSRLNDSVQIDPNANTYYTNAETVIHDAIGDTPRTPAEFEASLQTIGLSKDDASFIRQNANVDRNQYQRILDDFRQIALTRKNSERRATLANAITSQMANLGDNNTVGAIQLLSAQNSVKYAQDEDLLKTQQTILKNMEEQQMRAVSQRATMRQQELKRVQNALSDPGVPYVNNVIP